MAKQKNNLQKMKNIRIALFSIAISFLIILPVAQVFSQDIKTTKEITATSVKNQGQSGTCWSFATMSFLESELLRLGKGDYDLSEMYAVRMAYIVKADRYLRLQGHVNFGPGGQAHDVINVLRDYGMVPKEVYTGLSKNETGYDHNEMDAVLSSLVKSFYKPEEGTIDPKWKKAFKASLDAYLGNVPENFEYKGKKYTPSTFAAELGLNPDDYIEITSFTHHPFYRQFVLEVPDNWASGEYYNIPMDELLQIIAYAINNGYTVAWDGDISDHKSFSSNGGIATVDNEDTVVTAEVRQEAFDDFSTTDDHLMQLTGLGEGPSGGKYFLTKNSWGAAKGNNGYWWMSENYLRLKTIAIMVNKNSIPADIAKKMGIVVSH
jgi:bleomycin hydrolase